MLTRKIAKIVRGKATPFQIAAACFLGALLGATPGFTQGPGLYLALMAVLVVLNANLWIATLIFSLTKLLSLIAMSLQFEMGYWLIEGPTQSLFKSAVNTPYLAWFGLDYYVVAGSIPFGLIVGLITTLILSTSLTKTRRLLAKLDSKDPEERGKAEKFFRENKFAKFLAWVFIGKKGKKSYEDLAKSKIGNPIRPIGVVIVILFAGLIGLGFVFAQEPLVTYSLQSGLQKANGATVDLTSADLDLETGTLTASGLAMADPNNLDTDLLRAQTLTADIGGRDIALRRVAFDLIEINDASSGKARAIPGVLTRPRPTPQEPEEDTTGETKTIDDYLADAEKWKDRLQQLREWLDKINSGDPNAEPAPDAPQGESYRDRLRRQIAAQGYTSVRAEHLVEGAPTVLVRELRINGLAVETLPGETFDLNGSQLATQPYLVNEGQPTLNLTSRSGDIAGALQLASAAINQGRLAFTRNNLPGDQVGSMLAFTGQPPLAGGTVNLRLDTAITGATIRGTLDADLNNTTLAIAGNQTQVDSLTIPIGLAGPINAPSIALTDEALKQALIEAGKQELANRIGGEAGKIIDDAVGDNEQIKEAVDQVKDAIPGGLGGLLGGSSSDDDDDDP